MYYKYVVFVFLFKLKQINCDGYTFENPIRFPYGAIQGPFIGIFLALSLPLELPNKDIFFSYNVEANYVLPSNDTTLTYPPILSKGFTRRSFYNIVENKLKSHGYPPECLLRTICEAAKYSTNSTGVLGDIVHILLTPSTSINENLQTNYEEAEIYGRNKQSCKKYSKKCKISLIDLISVVGNFFERLTHFK